MERELSSWNVVSKLKTAAFPKFFHRANLYFASVNLVTVEMA